MTPATQLPAKADQSQPMGIRGIIPRTVAELLQLGDMAVACNLAPRGLNPKQAAGIMGFGMELGMSPFQALSCISFINGKAGVYGEGITALIQSSGQVEKHKEWFDGEGDDLTAHCMYWRKGQEEPYHGYFSVAEAKQAALWGKGNWAAYPRDQLMWKARGRMNRAGFSDITKGLWIREELEDFQPINGSGVRETRSLRQPSPPPRDEGTRILDEIHQDALLAMGEAPDGPREAQEGRPAAPRPPEPMPAQEIKPAPAKATPTNPSPAPQPISKAEFDKFRQVLIDIAQRRHPGEPGPQIASRCADLLDGLTGFQGKDGWVDGKRSLVDLAQKQAWFRASYGKAKKLMEEEFGGDQAEALQAEPEAGE